MSDVDGLVLLHGFGLGARSWSPQIQNLQGLPVVAYDALGHGCNRVRPDDRRLSGAEALVDELEDVIEARGWGRVVIVGLSMGGNTALLYSLRNPRRIAGLALLSAGSEESSLVSFRRRAVGYAYVLRSAGLEQFSETFLGQPRFATLTEVDREFVRKCILHNDADSLAAVAESVLAGRERLLPVLKQLVGVFPVLMLSGQHDSASADTVRRVKTLWPAVNVRIIEDVGHLLNIERPSETSTLLSDFISDVRGG